MNIEKTNTGFLFKNDKKEGNQPDYRGDANIDGTQFRIAAWLKDGAKGKYFSFKFTPEQPERDDAQIGMQRESGQRASHVQADLEDVPF